MRKILLLGVLLIGTFTVYSQSKSSADSAAALLRWHYKADTDRMYSTITYIAQVDAKDKVYIDMPDKKNATATLILQNDEALVLNVSRGYIGEPNMKQISALFRFDDEQPVSYTFGFLDNENITVDDSSARIIIDKLKRTKRLLIEIEFNNRGNQVLEFNVAGLKWEHKEKTVETNSVQERKIWMYRTDTNQMNSAKTYHAYVYAKDILNLSSPYDGGSKAVLHIQSEPGFDAMFLHISKGDFGTSGSKSCSVLLRFDDEQPVQYVFNFLVEEDKSYIGVTNAAADEIMGRIKKAKRVRAEVEFDRDGKQVMEFNVAGLKWDHKPIDKQLEHWQYGADTDIMYSDIRHTASLYANNILYLSPSYTGGSYVDIQIQGRININAVVLGVSRGQIGGYGEKKVNVLFRFDEESPVQYAFSFFKEGDTKEVSLKGVTAEELIRSLKKAKRLRMEMEFYKDGKQVLDFDVAGLKWDHFVKQDSGAKEQAGKEKSGQSPQEGQSNSSPVKINVTSTVISNSKSSSGSASLDSMMSSLKAKMSNVNMSNGGGSSSEISINGAVVDTKDMVDHSADEVKLQCTYKNTNPQNKTITIKAYFMDEAGNILASKSVSLSCSGNAQVSTDIKAKGIIRKYKSCKIEIE